MISQCDMGVILVGVARLEGVDVVHENQRLVVCQLLDEPLSLVHGGLIRKQDRFDKAGTENKIMHTITIIQLLTCLTRQRTSGAKNYGKDTDIQIPLEYVCNMGDTPICEGELDS